MTNQHKICASCGLPLEKPQDFSMGDEQSIYCRYCADENGQLKSYEDVHEGLASFLMFSQDLDESTSEKMADSMLKESPAWEDKSNKKNK